MSTRILKLIIALGATVLLTSACSFISVNNSGSKSLGGGKASNVSVFFSTNGGSSWQPRDAVPVINGQVASINGLNIKTLRLDPEDSSAVYLASFSKGLYYTYNINKGWNRVTSLPLATINDVQVDPQNKCIIYTAMTNHLYRSNDCSRTWSSAYFNSNPNIGVNTIAIDPVNSRNIYIGTSRGDIIKSIDGGNSWRTIHRLPSGVAQLIISPLNPNLLLVASVRNKIFSFTSNSNTDPADPTNISKNFSINNWTDFNSVLASYNPGANFVDIIINPKDGKIFLASDKLFLRSSDQGISWEKISLLSSKVDTKIRAIAVNPQNSADLYYLTANAFFYSKDSGVTWKMQKLPSGRAGQTLLIDPHNPNNIYLGTIKLKK